ncbi:hypothetical protein HYT26_02520 [Candidatus Pacearchaeota archaeon]|nr:hypothetical protein [Candidatus Pacearchaeota archaeon]
MDDKLKRQLDILLKNLPHDWDFTILISGSGEVRVGKSVIAMQIAVYCAYEMTYTYAKYRSKEIKWDLKTNFCFDGLNLIKTGHFLGANHPYSPLIYDEAGADIDAKKIMNRSTQQIMDYMRECGQYNLINILVIPDFFDFPKGIAITRSICLIDVTYFANQDDLFMRGYFNFYSRRQKKELYLKGKRMLDYMAAKRNFDGRFINFFPIDEGEYRQMKMDALKRRDSQYRDKTLLQRNAAFYILNQELNMTHEEIGRRIEQITAVYTPRTTITDAINGVILAKKGDV